MDRSYIDAMHVRFREQLELSNRINEQLKLSQRKVARRNKTILIGLPAAFLIGFFIKPK